MDDVVLVLLRSILDLENAVFTVGREEGLLASHYLQLVLFGQDLL